MYSHTLYIGDQHFPCEQAGEPSDTRISITTYSNFTGTGTGPRPDQETGLAQQETMGSGSYPCVGPV